MLPFRCIIIDKYATNGRFLRRTVNWVQKSTCHCVDRRFLYYLIIITGSLYTYRLSHSSLPYFYFFRYAPLSVNFVFSTCFICTDPDKICFFLLYFHLARLFLIFYPLGFCLFSVFVIIPLAKGYPSFQFLELLSFQYSQL